MKRSIQGSRGQYATVPQRENWNTVPKRAIPAPSMQALGDAVNQTARVATAVRAAPSEAMNKRVLIIDDNERVLEILTDFLGEAYRVDTASTPSAGLKMLASNLPDVILLDVNMPGTDGLTLLESLRNQGMVAPVFIMTGYDSPGVQARAKASGATAYLVKPIDLRHLDRLIASALHVPPLIKD